MTSSTVARVLHLSFAAAFLLASAAEAAKFACTSSGSAGRCQALLGYTPRNATTLAAVKSLFQLRSFRVLLAANNLALSTPPTYIVLPGATVRVRFPCVCSGGSGVYKGRPIYTVRSGDSLDAIARNVFGGLVMYQEIAVANNILDPDRVEAGQKLWIPLPCSCDEVAGVEPVVHYAHAVVSGSSVAEIAAEFGTTNETLMKLNGISDPRNLQAGQILDVPLRACSSSISNISPDHGLRIPNGSYFLTANNCVLCSCSSSSWQLNCYSTKGLNTSVCPAATCGTLDLGNSSSSTSSVCESQTCVYTGYTNFSNSLTILTNLTTQSLCNNEGTPLPQPNGGSFLRSGAYLQDLLVLCIVQVTLLWFGCARFW